MESSGANAFAIFISGICLGLCIYVVITFFKMARDMKEIKESIHTPPTGNDLAILKLLEGKTEEAIQLIRETFILECISLFEKYLHEGNLDDKGTEIIHTYVRRYRNILPEIRKEFLQEMYASVEKVYADK